MAMRRSTTPACRQLLPQALIDYLWRLAGPDDEGVHSFTLSAKYTGGSQVQEILHLHNNFSSWRRVFGYPPVNAVVQVRVDGRRAVMSLAGDAPAPERTGRETGLLCPA